MTEKPYCAKMIEDGCTLVTDRYATIDEAIAAGRKSWMTNRFDIIELSDYNDSLVYEAVRYIPH